MFRMLPKAYAKITCRQDKDAFVEPNAEKLTFSAGLDNLKYVPTFKLAIPEGMKFTPVPHFVSDDGKLKEKGSIRLTLTFKEDDAQLNNNLVNAFTRIISGFNKDNHNTGFHAVQADFFRTQIMLFVKRNPQIFIDTPKAEITPTQAPGL